MQPAFVDWVVASAAGICGLGLALWVTALWRVTLANAIGLDPYEPFKKLVLFLLVGSVPGVIQGMAYSPGAGGLTFALYVGGVGIGFVIGWVFTQGQGSINAGALRQQFRLVNTPPSNLEVFSLATLNSVWQAMRITGLSEQAFNQAFEHGAEEAGPFLEAASPYQRSIFMRVFAGEPISAIARDNDKDPAQIARDFAQLITQQGHST